MRTMLRLGGVSLLALALFVGATASGAPRSRFRAARHIGAKQNWHAMAVRAQRDVSRLKAQVLRLRKQLNQARRGAAKGGTPADQLCRNLAFALRQVLALHGGVATSTPGGTTNAPPPQPPQQSEWDVILVSPGGAKLNVVKVVKSITGLGLKEAKGIVDSAPAPVKEKLSRSEAEAVKAQLEEAGAEVKLQ